ncbi:2-hydroxyhepta-2,4-diene-1,7-dioate isomerase, partial [Rhodobacteraceae bacterium R_SAG2]|nr:2-hydroxyhepta-2,4-diene-1,7-dioate isomerase [Rhodobacteraceae bacterium R_SAG2]
MRFATYTADGETFYGAVTDAGMIALSPHFPDWPTLRDVIAADGLPVLAQAAEGKPVTHTNFT